MAAVAEKTETFLNRLRRQVKQFPKKYFLISFLLPFLTLIFLFGLWQIHLGQKLTILAVLNCGSERRGKGKETNHTDGMFIIAHSGEFTVGTQQVFSAQNVTLLGLYKFFLFPCLGKLPSLLVTVITYLPLHWEKKIKTLEILNSHALVKKSGEFWHCHWQ